MAKQRNYKKTAELIIEYIGGSENLVSVAHCATRLRLVLKDDSKIDIGKIENIDLVKGSFNNGGQFQIVLGTGIVDQVAREFIALSNLSESSKEEVKKKADE